MLRKHFQSHSKTVFSETKSDPGPHGPIGSTTHSLFSLPIEGNNCPPPPPPPPPPPFPPPNEPGVVDSSSVSPHVEDGGDSGAWMDGEGITTVVASGRIAPLESAALPSSTVGEVVCVYVHAYTCRDVCMCVRVCVLLCVCMYTCICMCMYVCACVCVCVYMSVDVHV